MPVDDEPLGSELIRAVELLGEAFAGRAINYALLGGLATTLRGRPRFTQDVDVLLDVPQLALPSLLDELIERGFTLDRTAVIRQYLGQHMSAFHYGSVRIDWLKPMLPLYAHALANASTLTWTPGHPIRVVKPEGIILTKLLAFRPQDQADIETLLLANRDDIDANFVRREWSAFAAGEAERTAWLEGAFRRILGR
jgi:hypothetical protein